MHSSVSMFPVKHVLVWSANVQRRERPHTNLDSGVIRSSRKDIIIELETGDTIFMTLENRQLVTAVLPVVADLPAIAVDGLPAPRLGLRYRLGGFSDALALLYGILFLHLCRALSVLVECVVYAVLGVGQFHNPPLWPTLGQLSLSCVVAQLLALQQGQSPSTLCTFPVDVLLAHADPDGIGVGEGSPPLTDLGGLGQADGVEIAQDLLGELDGEGRDEVDLEGLVDFSRDERELGEAKLGEDTLKHQVAVSGRSGGEEGPHVGNSLLILC